MIRIFLALGLAFCWGEDNITGTEQTQPLTEIVVSMKEQLAQNPSLVSSLASRIQRSSFASRISNSTSLKEQHEEILRWINANPETAANIAIGLAQDDQEGNSRFEDTVNSQADKNLRIDSAHVRQSIYGRLKKSSLESRLMRQDEAMSNEEKREILKSMFEGKGGMSNQIINQAQEEKTSADSSSHPGFSAGTFDRLSQSNLRGYSPEVMAIQNSLNQRRVPGAPKLVETGKLDYATLSYPAYGMRYDIQNLQQRLLYQRNFELARRLGLSQQYSAQQLLEAEVSSLLEQKGRKISLSPRFGKRNEAINKASLAVRDFAYTAAAAQDPQRLSKGLLVILGVKQKEAARWITVASLEEELQRVESEEGFLSPDLLRLIDACPVPLDAKKAYVRRGDSFKTALAQIKSNAATAIERLESSSWQAEVPRVEDLIARNASLRQHLSRNISNFIKTPYRLLSLYARLPRWRIFLDNALKTHLPFLSYSRNLLRRDTEREMLKDVFLKIAAGNLDAADAVFLSIEPPPTAKS